MTVIERMVRYMLDHPEPITVPELAAALPAKEMVVRNAMRRLKDSAQVHIAAYDLATTGNVVACWKLGGRIASIPRPSAQELMVERTKK